MTLERYNQLFHDMVLNGISSGTFCPQTWLATFFNANKKVEEIDRFMVLAEKELSSIDLGLEEFEIDQEMINDWFFDKSVCPYQFIKITFLKRLKEYPKFIKKLIFEAYKASFWVKLKIVVKLTRIYFKI